MLLFVGNGLQHRLQLVAHIDGHDGGGRFVRAETMIVPRAGDRDAQQILVIVHGLENRAQEQQKLRVLTRRIPRLKEIFPRIGGKRPVVVLAGTVHPGKGLFMQKALHAVLSGDRAHKLHGQLVVVCGNVHGAVHRRKLMLPRRRLVVLGLRHNAQLPQLVVELLHEIVHTFFDRAEIVVVELLPLGRPRAEQRAPGEDEILAPLEHFAVDEEILLLCAGGGSDSRNRGIAEQPQDAHRLLRQRLHRAQERGLFVKRRAGIGRKRRRDAQHPVLHECIARRVPGGIAPCLEGSAQAAGGKARGIRLALHELLAGEFHDRPPVAQGMDEAVMLFRRDAGHGLEPVGVMGRAALDRPVLHGVRHHGSDLRGQTLVVMDRVDDLLIGLVRQAGLHDRLGKHHGTEYLWYVAHIRHSFLIGIKRRKCLIMRKRHWHTDHAIRDAIAVSTERFYYRRRHLSSPG